MHEGPHCPLQPPPTTPPTHLSPRLRSVKIEQGKLNDQANTLADLAKVSRAGAGVGAAPQAHRRLLRPPWEEREVFQKELNHLLPGQELWWRLEDRQPTQARGASKAGRDQPRLCSPFIVKNQSLIK